MNQRTTNEIERDIARTRAEMSATIGAIQERLSPGQMFEQMLHYFSSGSGRSLTDGAGAFAQNMGRTIRDNPMPVALVATGLAWLMVSRGRRRASGYDPYEDYDEYDEYDRLEEDRSRHYGTPAYDEPSTLDDRPEPVSQPASAAGVGAQAGPAPRGPGGSVGTEAGPAPRGPGGSVGAASVSEMQGGGGGDDDGTGLGRNSAHERAQEAAEEARFRASRAADDARRQAAHVGAAAHGRSEDARGSAQGAGEDDRGRTQRAREGMDRAARAARRRAREAASAGRRSAWSARRQARRASSGFSHLLEERPLVVGLIGVAVGALLGSVLPATRREDEWLGETRDDLARRARAEVHKAERVAKRAWDTARSEAERHDLTPEGAKHAAADTVREAEHAAQERLREAAREAGRDAERAAGAKAKDVGDRLREVGEATREAAKDEAKRQDLGSGQTRKP
jgi:Protein of unknown function (DUF3618)